MKEGEKEKKKTIVDSSVSSSMYEIRYEKKEVGENLFTPVTPSTTSTMLTSF